jgi:hypothetical protein
MIVKGPPGERRSALGWRSVCVCPLECPPGWHSSRHDLRAVESRKPQRSAGPPTFRISLTADTHTLKVPIKPPIACAFVVAISGLTVAMAAIEVGHPPVVHDDAPTARRELTAAIAAMGGEQVLASVHTLELRAVGHRNMLEQSLRPDGPWWQDYFQLDEIRDFTDRSERVAQRHRGYSSAQWWLQQDGWDGSPTYVVSNGVVATDQNGTYASYANYYLQAAQEDLAFDPVPLLHTALAAPDLHVEPDVIFHGTRHAVVAFSWTGYPVQVYLNTYTHLPESVQWTAPHPYDVFWNPWGDVTTRIVYGMWSLEPNGLRYPRQSSIERDGLPDSDISITSLTVNPAVDPKLLSIPANVQQAARARKHTIDQIPLGIPGRPAAEIAPGIVHIPGAWNVNLICQEDGIVVLAGPVSSSYSVKVLAEAHRRFPKLPVKAVITTSDSWPHIGGLREYVARGIPIYALDRDAPILERLFKAPHRLGPDDLQSHPRAPRWRLFATDTRLGTGPNRLELLPYRTETGERQTMVYFPEYRLLYTSDLFAPDQGDKWFTPEYLLEVKEAVAREHLAVADTFGMHYDVTPWKAVTTALHGFLTSPPPPAAADFPPALASPLRPLAFFAGVWICAGKFAKDGKSIDSQETFTATLDGQWLEMRHEDRPPYHFDALELWGYDQGSRQFTAYVFDNVPGARHFSSSGWLDGRFTWTDTEPAQGVTDRFVFQRKDQGSYKVTYAITRDGKTWSTGDTLLCRRR